MPISIEGQELSEIFMEVAKLLNLDPIEMIKNIASSRVQCARGIRDEIKISVEGTEIQTLEMEVDDLMREAEALKAEAAAKLAKVEVLHEKAERMVYEKLFEIRPDFRDKKDDVDISFRKDNTAFLAKYDYKSCSDCPARHVCPKSDDRSVPAKDGKNVSVN